MMVQRLFGVNLVLVLMMMEVFVFVHADLENTGLRAVLRVYEECDNDQQGFGACLKKKALIFVDRLSRMEKTTFTDGVTVVRASDAPVPQTTISSEQDIEKNLPRSLNERDAALSTMLIDRIGSYVSSRTLQITVPEITGREISRGIEEGRGKMKKMMGMMMMGAAAKIAGLIPIAIAGLFLMAGKALLISKIALLLAVIIALKKIVAKKGGLGGGGGGFGGGHGGGGWQSSGGGGGWDKRSYEEAQKIAYKALVPQ